MSRNEQLCLGISLHKPEELERLSETGVCQIRKKKGLHTQLLFIHLGVLLFSITNLANNLVSSELDGAHPWKELLLLQGCHRCPG